MRNATYRIEYGEGQSFSKYVLYFLNADAIEPFIYHPPFPLDPKFHVGTTSVSSHNDDDAFE